MFTRSVTATTQKNQQQTKPTKHFKYFYINSKPETNKNKIKAASSAVGKAKSQKNSFNKLESIKISLRFRQARQFTQKRQTQYKN